MPSYAYDLIWWTPTFSRQNEQMEADGMETHSHSDGLWGNIKTMDKSYVFFS